MRRLRWEAVARPELHRQRNAGKRDVRESEDAQTTHLQQAGQRRGRRRHPVRQIHPVIRDQVKSAVKQTQQKVGLP